MKYKMFGETLLITIDDFFDGKSVMDFFEYYKKSKKDRYLYLENEWFLVNNKRANLTTLLKEKDVITVKRLNGRDYLEASENALVVYEDEFYYVVHKTKGMIIHEDNKSKLGTLNNLVSKNYLDSGLDIPVRPIHRLDYDTSGLVIYSKFSFFQSYLDYLISEKKLKRFYLAYALGYEPRKEFIVEAYLAKDRHVNNKYRVSTSGKYSLSKFKVLDTNKKYTLFECELETGLTHQIRVHLASINHSIINDKIYGKIENDKGLGLFAYKLILTNPLTFKTFEVLDPLISIDKVKEMFK